MDCQRGEPRTQEPRTQEPEPRTQEPAPRTQEPEPRTQEPEPRTPNAERRTPSVVHLGAPVRPARTIRPAGPLRLTLRAGSVFGRDRLCRRVARRVPRPPPCRARARSDAGRDCLGPRRVARRARRTDAWPVRVRIDL